MITERFGQAVKSFGRWPKVLLPVALYVGLGSLIFNFGWYPQLLLLGDGQEILDNRFGYDSAEVVTLFTAYGPEGRALYRTFLLAADFIYPLLFALMLGALLVWLMRVDGIQGARWRNAHLSPLALVVLDYIENAGVLLMLRQFPTVSDTVVTIVSTLTIVKMLGVTLLFVAIMLLTGRALALRLKRRQARPTLEHS